MNTYLDCMPCFLRQALGAVRRATNDESIHRHVVNEVAELIPKIPLHTTPPEIAQQVYRIIAEITGNNDPYRRAKQESNKLLLSLYPHFRDVVQSSADPLLTACKLAIAANSIDFAPQVEPNNPISLLEAAPRLPLAIDHYQLFRASLQKATQILYLGDNAGEIVLDRLLIEQLRLVSEFDITFAVREQPVINDATREDAEAIGLHEITEVITNGSDAPATILSQCSPRMLDAYHSADLIISKGQGNYESLNEERANIFFLLRAKCEVVATPLNVRSGDALLLGKHNGNQK